MKNPPTAESIATLIRKVMRDEKPSGRWKEDEPVIAEDGTVLSRFPKDANYFLGNRTAAEHEALFAANSVTVPGPDGLTWRNFSTARGYSEEQMARYEMLLMLVTASGESFAGLAHRCGYRCAFDAFTSEDGIARFAETLASLLPEDTQVHLAQSQLMP